nr:hypothetical protein [Dysosmobacter acutus]
MTKAVRSNKLRETDERAVKLVDEISLMFRVYLVMYATVCSGASDAIEAIDKGQPSKARAMLKDALEEAESLYVKFAPEEHKKKGD